MSDGSPHPPLTTEQEARRQRVAARVAALRVGGPEMAQAASLI